MDSSNKQLISLLQLLLSFNLIKLRAGKIPHAASLIFGGMRLPAGAIPILSIDVNQHYLEIMSPDEES